MSSVATSPERRTAEPEGYEWLRCPGERAAFLLCALSNFVVVALAVAIVLEGTSLFALHPRLAAQIDVVRTILIAAIAAVPAMVFARQIGFDAARHGGVRIGEHQFPELYAEYLRACQKLGLERVPELYLSLDLQGRPAEAHTLLDGRSAVILDADVIDDDWAEGLDFLTFAVARALGAIRMGHTRWWVELLTVYSRRIPGLRTPTLVKWTHSRDRCAAFVVPDGVRGLLLEAVGKHALSSVNVPAFLDQTEQPVGVLDHLANLRRMRPSLVTRARALYEAGFFDRARDRARYEGRR